MTDMFPPLIKIARRAGEAILAVRRSGDCRVQYKNDDSPLTLADQASQEIIARGLAERFPDVPVLSEEGARVPLKTRKAWTRFFLVDPLDGTKEFLKDNGEFCVCIAYMEGVYPVLGVVHAPIREATWWGGLGLGAFRSLGDDPARPIRTARPPRGEGHVVVASRSHPCPELDDYLRAFHIRRTITAGSAIKFCLVAEGEADLYPRFNPTMEWDTAAGQAIVEGAGGTFLDLAGERFAYNKDDLRNPGFLARA